MGPESCNLFMNTYTSRYNIFLSLSRKLSHLLVRGTRLIAFKKKKNEKGKRSTLRHDSPKVFVIRRNPRTNERKREIFFFFDRSRLATEFHLFLRLLDANRATRLLIMKRRYKYIYIHICVYINTHATYVHTYSSVYSCKLINVINDTGDRFSNSRRNK